MPRWEPDGRGRLEAAAMELYSERGYEMTTVAEIAERAGLTERTFFRHFADKREVLFGRASRLEEFLAERVIAAAPEVGPLDAIVAALVEAGPPLGEMYDSAVRRRAVVASSPELQERERTKLANLTAALRTALLVRDIAPSRASLAAEAGVAIFKVGFEQWIEQGNRSPLQTYFTMQYAELKALAGGPDLSAARSPSQV